MSTGLPSWLRPQAPRGRHLRGMGRSLASLGVHTVCQSARCPNLGECFGRGTATFLLMGEVCTRGCRFCAVTAGRPGPLDPEEPARVADAARRLGLAYVVITSVTRDDLPDGGAEHFSQTIRAIRDFLPHARVEVLVPDFQGNATCIERVLEAGPDVFGHNIEMVPRLYPQVRPRGDYRRSLEVLKIARQRYPSIPTKSGLMVGLGESVSEVLSALADLREVGVEAVTIGQYLPPSKQHYPAAEYVSPERFAEYAAAARAMGFRYVASGPLVRSSYLAEQGYGELIGAPRA